MLRLGAVLPVLFLASFLPVVAQTEVCDWADNDFNGYVDEGLEVACSSACGTGSSICAMGQWLSCSAAPCCDQTIGPLVDLCTAASLSGTTLCLLPGTYPITPGCVVGSNVISTKGAAVTILDGDLEMSDGRLQGVTVTGGVSNAVTQAFELFDDVVLGPVSESAVERVVRIQGNRLEQGFTSDNGVSLRDNEIAGGVSLFGIDRREVIGNVIHGGISFNTAADTLIEGNTIDDADVGILRFATAHDAYSARIVGNTVHAATTGMSLPFGGNDGIRYLDVLFNRVSGFSTDGISVHYFAAYASPRIEGNVVEGATAGGVGIGVSYGWLDPTGASGLRVMGNTVLNTATGIAISCPVCDGSDATLASNIIAFSGLKGVDAVPTPAVAGSNDFFGNASDGMALGPTDVSGDPLFVDPSGDDFHLRPESPCVDRGSPYAFVTDLVGRPRSQDGDLDGAAIPDIGALESTPEVSGLQVDASPMRVHWDPFPSATAGYDVYRGRWSLLHVSGIVQGPPLCGWAGTTFDADDPIPEGDGAIYLVAPHGAVEGSLGFDSQGTERPNPVPCP